MSPWTESRVNRLKAPLGRWAKRRMDCTGKLLRVPQHDLRSQKLTPMRVGGNKCV